MTALLWTACAEEASVVADRLAAAVPASARIVERVPGGRPVVAVVEVPAGDPRASGQPGAAHVVRALLGAGAAGAWLESGDGAYDLVRAVGSDLAPRVHVVPGGDDAPILALRRVTALVAEPLSPFARSRDLVVSGVAADADLLAYTSLRNDGLARYEIVEGLLADQGRSLAATALAEDGPVVVGVAGPAAPAAVERLREAGATVVRVRPADLDELQDLGLWWAGLHAALPPVAPPEGGLPSLAGWVDALRPHAAAVGAWEDREEVRLAILAQVGDAPPELSPGDPRLTALARATGRLREHSLGPWTDPEILLASVRLCGRPKPGTAMSYDPLHDALKVADWVPRLDPDLVAAVLAHELTHAHDAHAAADALGTDPAGWALLLDTLPAGVGASVILAAEDRAYRVEAGLLDVLGSSLPTGEEAARIREDPTASAPDALRATLAVVHATPVGTVAWLQLVSDLTPLPTATP